LLRPSSSSKNIYKADESTNIFDPKDERKINNFSRRYFADREFSRRDFDSTGHIDFSTSEPRIHLECEEIGLDTITKDGVFGDRSGLQGDDIDTNEGGENKISVHHDSQSKLCFDNP